MCEIILRNESKSIIRICLCYWSSRRNRPILLGCWINQVTRQNYTYHQIFT